MEKLKYGMEIIKAYDNSIKCYAEYAIPIQKSTMK